MNATEAIVKARNIFGSVLNENGSVEDIHAAAEAVLVITQPFIEVVPDEDEIDAKLRERPGRQYDDES